MPAIDDTEYNILAYIVNNVNGGLPNLLMAFFDTKSSLFYTHTSLRITKISGIVLFSLLLYTINGKSHLQSVNCKE